MCRPTLVASTKLEQKSHTVEASLPWAKQITSLCMPQKQTGEGVVQRYDPGNPAEAHLASVAADVASEFNPGWRGETSLGALVQMVTTMQLFLTDDDEASPSRSTEQSQCAQPA